MDAIVPFEYAPWQTLLGINGEPCIAMGIIESSTLLDPR